MFQVCTSDFVSQRWIHSLFDENTTRITPLDFRRVAVVQFRTLAALCRLSIVGIENTKTGFYKEFYETTHALSRTSLLDQAAILTDKYQARLAQGIVKSLGHAIFSTIVSIFRLKSISDSNLFYKIRPGETDYEVVNNFYPSVYNPQFDNVSATHEQ
jgi:hypothetical protein